MKRDCTFSWKKMGSLVWKCGHKSTDHEGRRDHRADAMRLMACARAGIDARARRRRLAPARARVLPTGLPPPPTLACALPAPATGCPLGRRHKMG